MKFENNTAASFWSMILFRGTMSLHWWGKNEIEFLARFFQCLEYNYFALAQEGRWKNILFRWLFSAQSSSQMILWDYVFLFRNIVRLRRSMYCPDCPSWARGTPAIWVVIKKYSLTNVEQQLKNCCCFQINVYKIAKTNTKVQVFSTFMLISSYHITYVAFSFLCLGS